MWIANKLLSVKCALYNMPFHCWFQIYLNFLHILSSLNVISRHIHLTDDALSSSIPVEHFHFLMSNQCSAKPNSPNRNDTMFTCVGVAYRSDWQLWSDILCDQTTEALWLRHHGARIGVHGQNGTSTWCSNLEAAWILYPTMHWSGEAPVQIHVTQDPLYVMTWVMLPHRALGRMASRYLPHSCTLTWQVSECTPNTTEKESSCLSWTGTTTIVLTIRKFESSISRLRCYR